MPPANDPHFDLITIAASAGGIKALMGIVSRLSTDLPVPVVVAQHLPVSTESQLDEMLTRRTSLRVKWAEHDETLKRGTIYLAPQRSQVTVQNGRLIVARCPRGRLGTPPADPLFQSVAKEFKSRAIAVVLTGCLWDGAAGIQALKQSGATILIQSPGSSLARGMPEAAIETTGLHFVLPLSRIPLALGVLTSVPAVVPLLTDRGVALRYWLQYNDNSVLLP